MKCNFVSPAGAKSSTLLWKQMCFPNCLCWKLAGAKYCSFHNHLIQIIRMQQIVMRLEMTTICLGLASA